jgi:hypothetical protein
MNRWAQGYEAEWLVYEEEVRSWRAGERRDKPRAPFQRGPHIDSLPIEQNGSGSSLPMPALDDAYAAGAACAASIIRKLQSAFERN